jgi:hypothetical protein
MDLGYQIPSGLEQTIQCHRDDMLQRETITKKAHYG